MNHPTRRVLYFAIVLLLLALAFAAIANASSENESARYVEPQVSVLQPPPPPVTYTLAVNINPGGSGTVTKNPNLPAYISGTAVILTANPATGYKFDNWTGDLTAAASPATITVTKNSVVTANFSPLPCWTLTITKNPVAGGNVSPNIAPNCTGGTQYINDTTVILTPSANPGYVFSGWTGCDSTSGTTCTVKMNAAKPVTVNFGIAPPPPPVPTNTSAPAATATSAPAATATSSPLATITPLIGGVVVATATVAPTPSSSLPSTGASPLIWIALGLVLVIVAIGARYMRQSAS